MPVKPKTIKVSDGNKSRTRRRVANTEPKKLISKSAKHKEPVSVGGVDIVDGEVFISVQVSELVPVAQFANVQLGPVQLSWKLSDINMSNLIDVDWGGLDNDGDIAFDESSLTPIQYKTYNKIKGALRASSKVVSHLLSEDRWLVDESVHLHNLREEREKEKNSKKQPYTRRK